MNETTMAQELEGCTKHLQQLAVSLRLLQRAIDPYKRVQSDMQALALLAEAQQQDSETLKELEVASGTGICPWCRGQR